MTPNDPSQKPFKTPPGYWQRRKPALKALARSGQETKPARSLWQRPQGWPWLAAAVLTGLALYVWQMPTESPTSSLTRDAIVWYLRGEALPTAAIPAEEPPEIKTLFQADSAPARADTLSQKAILQYLKAQNPENLLL